MTSNYSIATTDGYDLRAGLTLESAKREAQLLANERGESLEVYRADGTERDEQDNDSIRVDPQ